MRRTDAPLYVRERLARTVRETAKANGHNLKKFEFDTHTLEITRPQQYTGYVSCKECVAIATITTMGEPPIDWKDGGLQRECSAARLGSFVARRMA